MRLKKGMVEDLDTAIDLQKMARVIDKIGELFEDEQLTSDEAVWAAALGYLSIFNATDSFANAELLNAAARALLKDASDVFESLPEPGEVLEAPGAEAGLEGPNEDDEGTVDDDEDDDDTDDDEDDLEEGLDENGETHARG